MFQKCADSLLVVLFVLLVKRIIDDIIKNRKNVTHRKVGQTLQDFGNQSQTSLKSG